jgi:two-component system, NtrC family, response regulator AtoC
MSDHMTVLLVGSERKPGGDFGRALEALPFRIKTAQDGHEALAHLKATSLDVAVVLLDLTTTQDDGIETVRKMRQFDPHMPLIVLSDAATAPATIVSVMTSGASDFLCDPFSADDLELAISRASDTRAKNLPAASIALSRKPFVGRSPGMLAISAVLRQIAWAEAPILIQGETGSGKEVIAREIHANSRRAKQQFFKLNCAALPAELVESELFGYERGAFTGAFQRKAGIFEAADGGTILLDEIGDMDVRLQAKLLQVLQDGSFQRIGGKETVKVNVRIIAATHRDIESQIAAATFREDLYYRLNVVNLVVPPLRERVEDLEELTEVLLNKHAQPGSAIPPITHELQSAMRIWHWPGNVRELENFARRLLIFQNPTVLANELRDRIDRRQTLEMWGSSAVPAPPDRECVSILEAVSNANRRAQADAILTALGATRWNRKRAAAQLNIDYKALLYKMKKLGIDQEPASETDDAVLSARAS